MADRMNAMWNCKNPFQGKFKRILTVCSAGLLRSPTLAWYLQKHYDFNCRAVGVHDYALVPIDDILIEWADIIIFVDQDKANIVKDKYSENLANKKTFTFDIPDIYSYREEELIEIIKEECYKNGINKW